MLQELGELGMALARVAARRALQAAEAGDAAPGEAALSDAGPGHAGPGDSVLANMPSCDVAREAGGGLPAASRSGEDGAWCGRRSSADHAAVFARLAREVRQTIALEARIAGGELGPAPRRPPTRQLATPSSRRPWHDPHGAAGAEPDGAACRGPYRHSDERLEGAPANVSAAALRPDAIIADIRPAPGFRPAPGILPDSGNGPHNGPIRAGSGVPSRAVCPPDLANRTQDKAPQRPHQRGSDPPPLSCGYGDRVQDRAALARAGPAPPLGVRVVASVAKHAMRARWLPPLHGMR